MRDLAAATACALALGACAPSDADYRADVGVEMHQALAADLAAFARATRALEALAPTPKGRGWDARLDADALQAMRLAWARARDAYEHVEGAVEPMFPAADDAIDSRYEDQLARRGSDAYAFDDRGVVGLDAVERVLWSDAIPPETAAFERSLAGYTVPAFPANEGEAADFKNLLCGKLAADAAALESGWAGTPLDVGAAYRGLSSLIAEQRDEIALGRSGAEESRYSRRTLEDLRANVESGEAIYGLFRTWLATKSGGGDVDARIEAGFAALGAVYAGVPGSALPDAASSEYGALQGAVAPSVDPAREGSIPFEMGRGRTLLGL